MTLANSVLDAQKVADALRLLVPAGDVIEIRALECDFGRGDRGVASAYFTDPEIAAAEVAKLDGYRPKGIYFVLNQINPACLSRSPNIFIHGPKVTTSDADISARRVVPIDIDSIRPAGVSATEVELQEAMHVADVVQGFLTDMLEWPRPISGCSGNGGHLLYRIDVPNTPEIGIAIKAVLDMLKYVHGSVDTTVHNASRIWKLPGTISRKGAHSDERPHRMAYLINTETQPLTMQQLMAGVDLAAQLLPSSGRKKWTGPKVDVPEWCKRFRINIKNVQEWPTKDGTAGKRFVLECCPFNPQHAGSSAAILQFDNGAVAYKCHHNSCADKRWRELRAHVGDRTDDAPKLTDLGNELRFVRQHAGIVRHTDTHGWLHFNGKHWERDEAPVRMLAVETVKAVYQEAADSEDGKERERLGKFALKSEALRARRNMVDGAQHHPELATTIEAFDADPFLVNCANGTLNLVTGEFHEHRASDMLMKCAPVTYDPRAQASRFRQFVSEIFDDNDDLIEFVQRAAGYSLSGDVRERCVFVAHGGGDNGKSTLMSAFRGVMGDYAVHIATETITVQKNPNNCPPDLPRVYGARFVTVVETNEGQSINESLLKQMSGGTDEPLVAKLLYHDPFSFLATFKLWLACNHRPRIRGVDNAIWNRIRLIPFDVTIPKDRQDPELVEMLKREQSGIFNWMLNGFQRWMESGLRPPAAVLAATTKYRSDQDLIAQWIDEVCECGAGRECSAQSLHASYSDYCRTNGDRPCGKKAFGERLESKGFDGTKGTGGMRMRLGIALIPAEIARLTAQKKIQGPNE